MNFFLQARENVSLLDFLVKELNAKQVKTEASIRLNACPNPKCSPNPSDLPVSVRGDFFRCFACGCRGDVSAAASVLWAISPSDAAKRLVRTASYSSSKKAVVADTSERAAALQKILTPLRSSPIDPDGAAWMRSRGLSDSTIQEAVRRGLLAFLPGSPEKAMSWLEREVEEEAIRMAGMWREGARAPSIIFRPVVFTSKSSAEFRLAREPQEREPKALRYGRSEMWVWQGNVPGYAIVSGMLDLLSLAQLGYRGTIYGLPGATVWNSDDFPHPGQGRAHIVFEGGSAGASQSEKLKEALSGRGIEAIVKPAQEGTGVNGLLTKQAT